MRQWCADLAAQLDFACLVRPPLTLLTAVSTSKTLPRDVTQDVPSHILMGKVWCWECERCGEAIGKDAGGGTSGRVNDHGAIQTRLTGRETAEGMIRHGTRATPQPR